jgi:hypothetical protein
MSAAMAGLAMSPAATIAARIRMLFDPFRTAAKLASRYRPLGYPLPNNIATTSGGVVSEPAGLNHGTADAGTACTSVSSDEMLLASALVASQTMIIMSGLGTHTGSRSPFQRGLLMVSGHRRHTFAHQDARGGPQ